MKHAKLGLFLALAALVVAPGAAAESKKPTRATVAMGQRGASRAKAVEVLWGGRWWPAEVVTTRAGLTRIHYTGWGSEWDEWVGPSRIRTVVPVKTLTRARVGQSVSIEWHGRWWDGEVIDARSGFYKVHYTGWGSEWDEWLEPSRLRARSKHRALATGR